MIRIQFRVCKIWGSLNGGYEEFYHLGYNACHLFQAGVLFGLFFDPENVGDIFLRNVN
jgi:hypothetical protein